MGTPTTQRGPDRRDLLRLGAGLAAGALIGAARPARAQVATRARHRRDPRGELRRLHLLPADDPDRPGDADTASPAAAITPKVVPDETTESAPSRASAGITRSAASLNGAQQRPAIVPARMPTPSTSDVPAGATAAKPADAASAPTRSHTLTLENPTKSLF